MFKEKFMPTNEPEKKIPKDVQEKRFTILPQPSKAVLFIFIKGIPVIVSFDVLEANAPNLC